MQYTRAEGHAAHRGTGWGRSGARLFVWAASAVLVLCGGCLRPAPPKLNLARPEPAAEKIDLVPYLQAGRLGEWVYERVELPEDRGHAPVRYGRRVTLERLSEGILETRAIDPLARYIHAGRSPATRPADDERALPAPLPARDYPHLFELAEPMAPIPPELSADQPVESTTSLRYHGRRGRLESTGTLTRRVRVEGRQDVDCPAGHFPDCLRVRVELEIRFPFGPVINWNSYSWLSKEAGEVRRIDQFSGVFFIFGFGSAHEFRLASYRRDTPPTQPSLLSAEWGRGLITLDRGIPRPRISGMIIDFVASQPAP